ncbi:MAG: pyruvate, phosphate dikinase [Chloroflexi bacterium B3_Chlor]|nr:MAG: pyruvate, phosphate dikinase [Chloroflexi bacterium B3_Chlor]
MRETWVVPVDEGSKEMQPLLGGKGAGLAEMSRLGIPTVPGFVITTEAWRTYTPGSRSLTPALWTQVKEALADLEAKTGTVFGSPIEPLIVSVRSSPVVSMPGQLQTILNVGLTSEILDRLVSQSQRSRSWYDAYRRLILMYGIAERGIPKDRFADVLKTHGRRGSVDEDSEAQVAEELQPIVAEFLALFNRESGEDFPQDPYQQLERSIAAVLDSWFAEKPAKYREIAGIPDDLGTAVVVQVMVFGNLGPDSGSGVAFSRNPATGETQLYAEYLPNSQGHDLVAGLVTPQGIRHLDRELPDVLTELRDIGARLESVYRDIQDIEFTIEEGKLWILQTRPAKRTALAAVKTAVDMASDGLISRDEAVLRVDPKSVGQVFVPIFSDASSAGMLAEGIQSSPGAATGKVALDDTQVEQMASEGLSVILVRQQASADDAPIMPLVSGILTQRGGATSHAAVVARGQNKPCIVGCRALEIDLSKEVVRFGEVSIAQGDDISIDGTTGQVFQGRKEVVSPDFGEVEELNTLLTWADEMRRLQVLVDASTPAEIEVAHELGAEGIGLLRTEHMYHDNDFLPLFRDAILAESSTSRKRALNELEALHREEFRAICGTARGRPVTVRLLDAPLDHFLPPRDTLLTELAELRVEQGWKEDIGEREQLLQAIDAWRQTNPEYGLRGARLAVAVPSVVRAQVEALVEGTCDVAGDNSPVHLRILVPFVVDSGEVHHFLGLIREVVHQVMEREGVGVSYQVGAAIATPRAALVAGELASQADFLCIDSDALTQTVFSLSREDRSRFLPAFLAEGLIAADPFSTLDEKGVGSLIRSAVDSARSARPGIEIGVYGIPTQDPVSVRLFHEWGLDSVSCHVSNLLAVRFMAAQAAID